jgi:lysophospholipid acyltransferase (LPLAT)-like uncharacterized protein
MPPGPIPRRPVAPVRVAWLARSIGAGIAIYLNVVMRTCRVIGPVTREQVVLAFWHEFNMLAFVVARKRRGELLHASFSTSGFRGAVITSMLKWSGTPMRVFELPPEEDRAAGRALAIRMARVAEAGASLIVTPDGPFGPYRVAKPGALILARASGLPVQPWSMTLRPAIRLSGRWDRQLVPMPFCRIRVIEGTPQTSGARASIRPKVAELQAELERLDGLGDRHAPGTETSRVARHMPPATIGADSNDGVPSASDEDQVRN